MRLKMPGIRRSRYGICPRCNKRGLRYEERIGGGQTLPQGWITCRYCGATETVRNPRDISAAVRRLRERHKALFRFCVYEPYSDDPSYCVTRRTVNPLRLASRFIRWINYVWDCPGGVDCAVSRVKVWRVNVWPEGPTYIGERRAS